MVQRPPDEQDAVFLRFMKAIKDTAAHFDMPEEAVVIVDSLGDDPMIMATIHVSGVIYYHLLEFER